MIYSRGPWPKALVPDVPCKISGILNHFHKFKSQGGPLGGPQGGQWKAPHGLHDIFKCPRPKSLVSDVLCKISGILNSFNQFKTLGGLQGGQWKAPQGSHDIFKGPKAKRALVYDVLCKRSWRLKHWSVRYVLKCFPNTS